MGSARSAGSGGKRTVAVLTLGEDRQRGGNRSSSRQSQMAKLPLEAGAPTTAPSWVPQQGWEVWPCHPDPQQVPWEPRELQQPSCRACSWKG